MGVLGVGNDCRMQEAPIFSRHHFLELNITVRFCTVETISLLFYFLGAEKG